MDCHFPNLGDAIDPQLCGSHVRNWFFLSVVLWQPVQQCAHDHSGRVDPATSQFRELALWPHRTL